LTLKGSLFLFKDKGIRKRKMFHFYSAVLIDSSICQPGQEAEKDTKWPLKRPNAVEEA
jgi:hypothetical protein